MNIYRKRNIVLSLCIIIIAFIVGYILENNYSSDIKAGSELALKQSTAQYSSLIHDEMKNQKIYIESTGELMSKILGDNLDKTSDESISIITSVFKNKQLSSSLIHSVYFVYDATGDKIRHNGLIKLTSIKNDLRSRHWYKMTKRSKAPIISDVYNDSNSYKPCITISYPIYREARLLGVVCCDIFVEDIGNYFVDDLNEEFYDIYLLSPTGRIITKPEKNKLNIDIQKMYKKYFRNKLSEKINDIEVRGYHSNIDEFNWKLFVFNNSSVINDKLEEHLSKIRIFTFLICLLILALVNYLLNRSYNINNVTGFKSRYRLLKDIKKKSKYSDNATILTIIIKNINDINEQYGNDKADAVINNYAHFISEIFNDKATIYSASENKLVLLFKEIEKEQIIKSVEKYLMELKYKEFDIDKNKILIKSYIALIDLNKEEMEKINTTIPKIEQITRSLKHNNTFVVTSLKELSQNMDEDSKKLNYLRKAIEEDRIVPFFQPLLDIKTKEIIKYEVLMRIKDGEEFLSPYPFILIAEKNNLIGEIDLKMLEKALLYKNKIDKDDKLIFSFNLSGKVTNSTDYLNKANSIIDKYGVKHENIIFEITETENIENLNKFVSIIKEFKKNNYQFSIDDFGVGFSSIYYLKNVPSDYLKIDGSFIKDINEKEENLYLVKSIVNMAKAFKLKTVAEFVESEEILKVIEKLGVDYAQGYYINKPCSEIV
ncbi:hypothetical protein SH2C18_18230 [Clostridium sediminicola]|uniref:EAL domain-containing protein n=1 Tax=Clostridium sediminicola TaxID=3114879 RepID=UPI0031F268C8